MPLLLLQWKPYIDGYLGRQIAQYIIESFIPENDIELVAQQTNHSIEESIASLIKYRGDIINAIMSFPC